MQFAAGNGGGSRWLQRRRDDRNSSLNCLQMEFLITPTSQRKERKKVHVVTDGDGPSVTESRLG